MSRALRARPEEEAGVTFEEWTRHGMPKLLRFATVLCGSGHLAEDLVQDTALKAHRHWERIQAAAAPEAYLRKMVVNEYLSWRHKWARFIPRPEIRDDSAVTRDHADRHADADELLAQLGRLPRRQRAVLVLRYYGGQTDNEIAETLGCSPSTVRAHASRALAALRVELTDSSFPVSTGTGVTHAH